MRGAAGDLGERESAALERHLSGCAGCAAEMAGLRATSALFAAARTPAAEPPLDLASRVLDRIAREVPTAPRKRFAIPSLRWNALGGGLALGTAAVGVMLVLVARNAPMDTEALLNPDSAAPPGVSAPARDPDAPAEVAETPAKPPMADGIAKSAPIKQPTSRARLPLARPAAGNRAAVPPRGIAPKLKRDMLYAYSDVVVSAGSAGVEKQPGGRLHTFFAGTAARRPDASADKPSAAPARSSKRVMGDVDMSESGREGVPWGSAANPPATAPSAPALGDRVVDASVMTPSSTSGSALGGAAARDSAYQLGLGYDADSSAGRRFRGSLARLDSEPEARLRAEAIEKVYMSTDERAKTILKY